MTKRIFICYSRKDESWKKRLESQLKVLKQTGVSIWSDAEIEIGQDWSEKIDDALRTADMAILLISSDFLNSEFITNEEIPLILKRRHSEELDVLPILIRPCPWEHTWLKSMQVWQLRKNDEYKALSQGEDHEQESSLADIAIEVINKLIDEEGPPTIEPLPEPQEKGQPILHIPCSGRPDQIFMTSNYVYMLTEANEWYAWNTNGNGFHALPSIPHCSSVIIERDGTLAVGLYEKMAARLKNDKWSYIPHNQAILALASTSMGLVIGDDTERIFLLSERQGEQISPLQAGEPILQLMTMSDEGIVALGCGGGLWTTEWPMDSNSKLTQVDTDTFERPYALYPSGRANSAILMGAKRLGLLHFYSGTIRATSEPIADSLRSVCTSPNSNAGFAVLTDSGELYLVSHEMQQINQVKIAENDGRVIGMQYLPQGGLLVWTAYGNLFHVNANRGFEYLAGNHVVMAFASPDEKSLSVLRWQPATGTHLNYERLPLG